MEITGIKYLTFFVFILLSLVGLSRESFVSHNVNDAKFLLFPMIGSNYSKEIKYGSRRALRNSGFVHNAPTVIMIPGFASSVSVFNATKDGYLWTGLAKNVIMLNWTALSTPRKNAVVNDILAYPEVIKNVEPMGRRVAYFIKFLVENALSLRHVHIIGHSLGAHVAGVAGSTVKEMYYGKTIRRITGLDPAGPLFEPPTVMGRHLTKYDAAFVDVIHSNMAILGSRRVSGHADFYPNGGVYQLGCNDLASAPVPIPGLCSHSYSINIYTAAFYAPYGGCKCPPGNVNFSPTGLATCLKKCHSPTSLGPLCPPGARGLFFLTAPNPP